MTIVTRKMVHWDDPEGWYGEGGGRRVQDLKPDDATIPLLAAKLCVGSLHWVSAPEAFSFLWVERRQ